MQYGTFRAIQHIGQLRAYEAARADHRADPQEPAPRQIHDIIKEGSWADIFPSYTRVNRYARTRGRLIETAAKQRRLKARRASRQQREMERATSIFA